MQNIPERLQDLHDENGRIDKRKVREVLIIAFAQAITGELFPNHYKYLLEEKDLEEIYLSTSPCEIFVYISDLSPFRFWLNDTGNYIDVYGWYVDGDTYFSTLTKKKKQKNG